MTRRRSKGSSGAWLAEHFEDEYVRRAQKEGYRSRAAYKLMELDARDRLIRPGLTVVDLGAAPGGWAQYVAGRLARQGRLVVIDLLPIAPVPGAEVIQGDITDPAVVARLLQALGGRTVDLVLSDMAPNISGVGVTDQARAMGLAETALEFARQVLGPGGRLVIKVFQGPGFDELRRALAGAFEKVVTRKPKASRARSAEIYLVASGFRRPVS